MIYIGIDIGSTASKVAVMGDKEMLFVLPTGWSSKETILTIKEKLMENGIDVTSENVKVVATGYGRVAVDFADHIITEITCHARGGREMAGDDCTIIDVGGQDTKIIIVQNGMVSDFLMNDKCSAGTGKFLEIMANRLGVTLQELFELAKTQLLLNTDSIQITATKLAELKNVIEAELQRNPDSEYYRLAQKFCTIIEEEGTRETVIRIEEARLFDIEANCKSQILRSKATALVRQYSEGVYHNKIGKSGPKLINSLMHSDDE